MSYDGSVKWQHVEAALARDGFALTFACTYGESLPADLEYTGRETGWELRRKLKSYCASHGITNFQIIRNTSYHRDLHGNAVYELWTRPNQIEG
jgi:hypothetical protein